MVSKDKQYRIEQLEAALFEIVMSARTVGDWLHVNIARAALEGKKDEQ